jgi:S1-C subfamily serine protease
MRMTRVRGGGLLVLALGLPLALAAEQLQLVPLIPEQRNSLHPAPSPPGYLGIDVRDVSDDQVSTLHLKNAHGAEVIGVDHDGPAGRMGLHEHDVIVQLNGILIEGRDQISRLIHEMPPGRTVVLVVSRQGQALTLSSQMADLSQVERQAWEQHLTTAGLFLPAGSNPSVPTDPPSQSPLNAPAVNSKSNKSFLTTLLTSPTYTGAVLEPLSPQLGQFFGVTAGHKGLLVRNVAVNSPAEMGGLRAGDVVTRADLKPMVSLSAWTRSIKDAKGRPVTVTVLRDRQEKTLTVIPDVKHK